MFKRLTVTIWVLMLLLVALPARAGLVTDHDTMPTFFKRVLHKWEDYKLLIIKGKNPSADVDRLMAAPEAYYIVAWQVLPQYTKDEDIKRLLEWASKGGVVLFEDSRLAQNFGFEGAPVSAADLDPSKYKFDHGDYGGEKKFPGGDTLVMAAAGVPHPTLAGVDAVQIFMLAVGDGPKTQNGQPGALLSCLRQTPDMIPLLKLNPTNDGPLRDRVAAGLRSVGDGYVVFKPLVWEEQYTGGRFQYNLLEWMAGYGVPDITASGPSSRTVKKTTAAAHTASVAPGVDRVVLLDHHEMNGRIVNKTFELVLYEPSLRTGTVYFNAVRSIVIQEDGARDAVTLVDGTKKMGSVSFPDDLQLRDASGKVAHLKKSEILRVTMHESVPSAPKAK